MAISQPILKAEVSKKRKAEEQKRREEARKEAQERLFDPLDFELPRMFLMGSDVWTPRD